MKREMDHLMSANPVKKFDLYGKRPLIIAGPCSAETREQTISTCAALATTGKVDCLRAGVWKPRTRPGGFEGTGTEGLGWLAEARSITGLPVAVEVATAKHVESALRYGMEALWIGARTTVSPFAVQDIAEALRGTGSVSVMIKNPLNPDPDLWAGAVERVFNAGLPLSRIGLVHRGFSYMNHGRYRNPPMWHIALEMRNRYPGLAMICDPSHICGRRDLLAEISQNAADLRYDGLMIESHICPDQALSDAAQQVTPEQFAAIMENIRWRSTGADDPGFVDAITSYRREIDSFDSEIFELFSRRMRTAEKIGLVKKTNNVAILQEKRWKDVTERYLSQAERLGLSREFMKTVLEAIHIESISRQNRVMNE